MAAISAKQIISQTLGIPIAEVAESVAVIPPETPAAPAPALPDVPALPAAEAAPALPDTPILDTPATPALPAVPDTATPALPEPPQAVAITDEAVMQYLKDKGVSAASIEELKNPKVLTPEEVIALQKQKKNEAIQFGLQKKIFTTDELSQHAIDSNRNSRDIAFQLFENEQRQKDPSATAEVISERFALKYGEDEEDGHWLKVQGQESMDALKDMYIQRKYENINGIEDQYSHENTIVQLATQYKNTIDSIFNVRDKEYKLTFADPNPKGGDPIAKEYKYSFSNEEIEAIKSQFLTPERFDSLSSSQVEPANISKAVDLALYGLSFDKIVASIARSYAADRLIEIEAERKNVMPEAPGGSATIVDAPNTENPKAQKVLDSVLGKK